LTWLVPGVAVRSLGAPKTARSAPPNDTQLLTSFAIVLTRFDGRFVSHSITAENEHRQPATRFTQGQFALRRNVIEDFVGNRPLDFNN
jgi:hypothetical protein